MIVTAFDFETCGPDPLSAVELGLAVFDDGRLVETRSWRFFPVDPAFRPGAVRINGIVREHVDGLATFDARWEQIKPYFSDTLVAHNASFDVRVLCSLLDHLQLPRPEAEAFCTLSLARSTLDRTSFRLDELCQDFRIPLLHHSSLSDAIATGYLLNCLAIRNGGLHQILDRSDCGLSVADWTPSPVHPDSWEDRDVEWWSGAYVSLSLDDISEASAVEAASSSSSVSGSVSTEALWTELIKTVDERSAPEFLAGWRFAISGDPVSGKREIADVVRSLGGACHDEGKLLKTAKADVDYAPTSVLLVAEEMLSKVVAGRTATGKLKSAGDMRYGKRSKPIKLIGEADFYRSVADAIQAGETKFDWDDYSEDFESVQTLWAILNPEKGDPSTSSGGSDISV